MMQASICPEISPEVLASISEPTFLLSPDGRVAALNPAALALCGRSGGDIVPGTPLSDLLRLHRDPQGRIMERLLEQGRLQIGAAADVAPLRETGVELLTASGTTPCELWVYPVARAGELPRHLLLQVRESGIEQDGFSLATSRWYTDALRRVTGVLQGSRDPVQFIDAVREVFGAERAWVIHPCAPQAAACELLVESAAPDYPGAMARHVPVPIEEKMQRVLNQALVHKAPIMFERMKGVLPDEVVKQFGIKSQMMVRVRPRTGRPWLLGIHQCAEKRVWSPEEQNLLASIGLHLTQAIDSHLLQHTLARHASSDC